MNKEDDSWMSAHHDVEPKDCSHHWGWFLSEEPINGFRKWIRCSICKLTLDDFTKELEKKNN